MEKIYFDDQTYIWKTKLNYVEYKSTLLKEAQKVMEFAEDLGNDAYRYKKILSEDLNFIGKINIEHKLDEILQTCIEHCNTIYTEINVEYNKVNLQSWINIVRAKEPIQEKLYNNLKMYHIHSEINKRDKLFIPEYTFVYYIQMPDVMNDEDGVLYFIGKNEKEYWVRPNEDELIIMPANIPHAPNTAPNSNLDRIVMAGNIGFELIKKQKSFL